MSNFYQNSKLNYIQQSSFPPLPPSRMHTKSSKIIGPFACSDHSLQEVLHIHLPVPISSLPVSMHRTQRCLGQKETAFLFLCLFVLWQLTLKMSITNYAILTLRAVRAHQSRLYLCFRKGGHNSHASTNSTLCQLCETAALKWTQPCTCNVMWHLTDLMRHHFLSISETTQIFLRPV